jgi:molecular chaperone HscB
MRGVGPVLSKFDVLGVPEKYDLDLSELERRYRERSREVHPDRFARAAAAERLRALEASSALNDAYRVLRNPTARAEHLLALRGVTVADNEPVPQDFLLEILELREALAEAKGANDSAGVARMEGEMRARHEASMRRIAELFASGGSLDDIRRELVNLRYFQRFLDEVEGVEAA